MMISIVHTSLYPCEMRSLKALMSCSGRRGSAWMLRENKVTVARLSGVSDFSSLLTSGHFPPGLTVLRNLLYEYSTISHMENVATSQSNHAVSFPIWKWILTAMRGAMWVQKSVLHHTTLQLHCRLTWRKMNYKTAIGLVIDKVKETVESIGKANMISLKVFSEMLFSLVTHCGSLDILVMIYLLL